MTQPEILLERKTEGRRPWAQRIYRDGRVEDYTDRDMDFENDEFVEIRIPLKWRQRTVLLPEEIEELITLVHSSGFLDLPASLSAEGKQFDASTTTWLVNLPEGTKIVAAVGRHATENPAIKQLRETITRLTAGAYRRDAGRN